MTSICAQGVPKDILRQDVDAFADDKGLDHIRDLLQRGALAAQSPTDIASIDELTGEDKQDLADEVTRRWHHPKILVSGGRCKEKIFLDHASC